ncbi:MAG: hypothetical protein L6R41_000133 [Letrouitia leprolyta]|nr:MAG: hypothetical protein L6R41_000133 [Letrouitia leprolyta]
MVSIVSLAPFALPILYNEPDQKDGAADRCNAYKGQRSAIPNRKRRSLARNVDVAGNDTTEVTESNLQGGADTFLAMPTEIVVDPHESYWLDCDISYHHREMGLS